MKYTVLVFLAVFLCSAASAQAVKTAQADFDAGCQAYKKGAYEDALIEFKSVERAAPSGNLYYNMGNTYFRLGRMGLALLYYERARKIAPSEDIDYNIKFAANLINDPDYGRGFFSSINQSVLKLVFAAALLLFSSVISFKLVFPQKKMFWALIVSCLIFTAASAVYFVKYGETRRTYAVVVDSGAEVRSGPDNSFKVNFTLPEGKKVMILGKSDKWIEIGVKSLGIRGWAEINRFEFI